MVTRRLIRWYWVSNSGGTRRKFRFDTLEEARNYATRVGYGYIIREERTPSGKFLSADIIRIYGIPETLAEKRELDRKYKRNRGFAPFYPFLG